ncbi:MAG TPA: ABC transporter substrate-binding protein [Candidatus Binatia bacterium]|nr:ABC transporter substrate-binding protein [Candidatus Binatia bacterium]
MKIAVALPQHVGPVHWSALIAESENFYRDEGLDVELRWMDQDDQTKSLLSGATPVERRGPDEDIALIEAGHPIRIIAGLVRKPSAYLYGARGVTSLEHLRGTTLGAVSLRFGSSLGLRMLLADAGLNEGDYTLQMVGGTQKRFEALLDGRVSAALLTPPTSARAAQLGLPLLASLPQRYPHFVFSSMQANLEFARAQPAAIVALLRAEIRAQRFLADPANRGAAIATLAGPGTVTPEDAALCYAEMVEQDDVFYHDAAIKPEDLATLIDGLRRLGDSECRQGASRYLDLTWLQLASA